VVFPGYLRLVFEVGGPLMNGLSFVFVTGERKDFEVYSCDVSPDGKRLVTAAGGEQVTPCDNVRIRRGLRLLGYAFC
jgi:hypothetical protein